MNGDMEDSTDLNQNLFKQENGRSLRIYVEPLNTHHRPRLVRSLKRAGAFVSHTPDEAQIILINPDDDGDDNDGSRLPIRGLIDHKDNPPESIVLNVSWAHDALKANKLLGFRNYYLGSHPSAVDGILPNPYSPLPTPRHTPAESAVGRGFPYNVPETPLSGPSSAPNHAPQLSVHSSPAMIQQFVNDFMSAPGMRQAIEQFSPQAFMDACVDVLKSHLPVPQFPNGNAQFMQHNQYQQPPFPLGHTQASPEEVGIPPSLKRHSREEVGKGRKKVQPSHPKKRQRFEDEDEEYSSESSSSSGGGRRAQSSRHLKGQARRPGSIFVDDNGRKLNVFVQLNFHSRQSIVDKIKEHGGSMVINIADAAYAVLYRYDKANIPGYLARCEQYDIPAVVPAYIDCCVEASMLLDVQGFLVKDTLVVEKARGRKPKIFLVQEDRDSAANQEKISTTKTKPVKSQALAASTPVKKPSYAPAKAKKSTPARPDPDESDASPAPSSKLNARTVVSLSKLDRRPTSRSPSPEPPLEPVRFAEGRNRFVEEERVYMLKYLGKLFKRDPEASLTIISKKMHEKMPQHTEKSWLAEMYKHSADIDSIRRKAAIQHRKTESAFEDIVTWFVDGHADNLADEAVWPALASEYPYMSMTEWQDYYLQHGVSVNKEVEARREDDS
ncbi:hypothetical protein BXZ70DRAFT_166488 [Cristinia sonorae]|uniref:BRCT domain-containing protein n=1 Tax=Cristinia sonorae TaxID=1940300 RepID=A0A8K0UN30_9AGAR|nr:hypothetical protein BXZ70DRAFT_166488 [Cristinia sonorae]